MTDILKRLWRIARSTLPQGLPLAQKKTAQDGPTKDGGASSHTRGRSHSAATKRTTTNGHGGRSSFAAGAGENYHFDTVPPQVVEDLAIFQLKPPSSLDEVRKARNREIKKYHSDMFLHDAERLDTSKQIMQIYNAAFDRLQKYYEQK